MPLSFSFSRIIISSITPKIQTLITKTMSSSSSSSTQSHAFAGNPLRSKTPKPGDPTSPNSSLLNLKTLILDNDSVFSKNFKFLPFRKGRPLASSSSNSDSTVWNLGWISLSDCKSIVEKSGNEKKIINEDSFVYLGSRLGKDVEEDFTYWAIDVENVGGDVWVSELIKKQFCFAELRTLMVATDWGGFERDGRISYCWTFGPNSMPCQLMVGFFAYAKSLEINVDKVELEDARWHSREDVKNALTFAEYEKAQRTAADKVDQMCKGVEKGLNFSSDFNVESGELAPMFIPGPFAIAHHLISAWINQTCVKSSSQCS
ncbi:hypothetical protein MKW92_013926 [Papaver armeniacum]|nr:hypothetical protein MKW92_013926 [Papaver armeniacum]